MTHMLNLLYGQNVKLGKTVIIKVIRTELMDINMAMFFNGVKIVITYYNYGVKSEIYSIFLGRVNTSYY